MDDGIELFIYLAFLLLSLVGGIYKNINKKKEKERQRQQNSIPNSKTYPATPPPIPKPIKQNTNPFEDFLKEKSDIEEEHPVVSFKDFITENKKSFKTKSEKERIVRSEGLSAFESTTEALLSDNMYEDDFSITDEVNSILEFDYNKSEISSATNDTLFDFDAKKAVIYAEILKRPNF